MRLALALPAVLIMALTACEQASPAPAAPTVSGVKTFAGLSHKHVKGHVDYPQTPPVGGKHNKQWLACDVYTEPVPNENAAHSMEHGGIWITYRPGLPAAQVATLADVQKSNQEYVLVSPYPGLPSPVVVSTWGLQLKVQSAADPRILTFVQDYAGGDQGNEKGAPCKTNGLTLDQARKAVG